MDEIFLNRTKNNFLISDLDNKIQIYENQRSEILKQLKLESLEFEQDLYKIYNENKMNATTNTDYKDLLLIINETEKFKNAFLVETNNENKIFLDKTNQSFLFMEREIENIAVSLGRRYNEHLFLKYKNIVKNIENYNSLSLDYNKFYYEKFQYQSNNTELKKLESEYLKNKTDLFTKIINLINFKVKIFFKVSFLKI